MIPSEARERMLAALAAAGVNGVDTATIRCASAEDDRAMMLALLVLDTENIAIKICTGVWRLSEEEFARRILRAVGLAEEQARVDAVAGILRGL